MRLGTLSRIQRDTSNGVLRNQISQTVFVISATICCKVWSPRTLLTRRGIESRLGREVEVNEINRTVYCATRYLKRCSYYRPPYFANFVRRASPNFDRPAFINAKRYRVALGSLSRIQRDKSNGVLRNPISQMVFVISATICCKFWPPRTFQREEVSSRAWVAK